MREIQWSEYPTCPLTSGCEPQLVWARKFHLSNNTHLNHPEENHILYYTYKFSVSQLAPLFYRSFQYLVDFSVCFSSHSPLLLPNSSKTCSVSNSRRCRSFLCSGRNRRRGVPFKNCLSSVVAWTNKVKLHVEFLEGLHLWTAIM